MTIYWNEHDMQDAAVSPQILAEGDSWFSYWIPGTGNLLNKIDALWGSGRTIYSTAYPGDEARSMLTGRSREVLIANLKSYSTLRMVLFSGGGNDIAAENLVSVLRTDCSGAQQVADCFRTGQPDARMTEIMNAYETLIELRDMHRPDAVIITHTYSYAIPDGRGVLCAGPWLLPQLKDAKVPVALRQPLVNLLMDKFAAGLLALQDKKFRVVDTRKKLGPDDWANELHPTSAGFTKIAQAMDAELKAVLS